MYRSNYLSVLCRVSISMFGEDAAIRKRHHSFKYENGKNDLATVNETFGGLLYLWYEISSS